MNRQQAEQIIAEESLQGYRFFENRPYRPDEVVIEEKDGIWSVYVISERAAKMPDTVDEYSSESEALADFIDRLRADKILRELL